MLRTALAKAYRRAKRVFARDYVAFEGAILPPPHMRYCGSAFRDDTTFLESGRAEARRLRADFGLGSDTRMLEIGCGPGRLPIGILAEFGEIARYDGVDIDSGAVAWCTSHVTKSHPNFRFHKVEAQHQRYNPHGQKMDDSFRLQFPDETYDLIYLHSVFANLEPDDIKIYSKEFHRLLKKDGKVFLTAFVEENVPPVTINPQDYLVESSGPLNVARYEKGFFLELLTSSGLELVDFAHGTDLGGQSVVHLRRP